MYLHLILGIIKHGLIKNVILLLSFLWVFLIRKKLAIASVLCLLGARERTRKIFEKTPKMLIFVRDSTGSVMHLNIPCVQKP